MESDVTELVGRVRVGVRVRVRDRVRVVIKPITLSRYPLAHKVILLDRKSVV